MEPSVTVILRRCLKSATKAAPVILSVLAKDLAQTFRARSFAEYSQDDSASDFPNRLLGTREGSGRGRTGPQAPRRSFASTLSMTRVVVRRWARGDAAAAPVTCHQNQAATPPRADR